MSESWKGIYKLMEEMGELQQALAKLAAFPNGNHPDMECGAPPLLQRLEDEIADVDAALTYFVEVNDAVHLNRVRRVRKIHRFFGWGLAGVPLQFPTEESQQGNE